jgi:hypothetical protein
VSAAAGTPVEDGILFGPNANGKSYLSWFEHRGGDRRKSQWAIDVPPAEEYEVFCTSDYGDWVDDSGTYWGVRDAGGRPLGTRGERVAKFPRNDVPAVPWHGYPVSPGSGRPHSSPPDDLVLRWIGSGFVTRTFGRKIQRRKA